MLRKLKAVVTVGLLGACAGVALGLWISVLSSIVSGPGRRLPPGGVALETGLFGGLAGSLFALGLILYARLRGGTDKRLGTILGAAVGVLAFPILVLVRDLPVSHWGVVNWIIVLAIWGYFGAWAGRFVWSVADVGEETGEPSAPDQASIRGPDVLDEASVREEPARDHQPLHRRGGS